MGMLNHGSKRMERIRNERQRQRREADPYGMTNRGTSNGKNNDKKNGNGRRQERDFSAPLRMTIVESGLMGGDG